jgi:uncharacterized SAM-binding protein YcdF (DUF218 family)
MVYRMLTVIVILFLLAFFGVLVTLFMVGGIRNFHRFGWSRRGVVLQCLAALFLALFALLAASLFRLRGELWLFRLPGLFTLLCLSCFAILGWMLVRSERYLEQSAADVPCDFVVVLGAGLVDGRRVTRLLAGRVDKGIEVFEDNGRRPLIVLSGGQGKDELVSEARAMRAYALERGIPSDDLLLEERSTSTKENLRYSREVMDVHWGRDGHYRCAVVTNEFHMMRTERLARAQGFSIMPVACRTSDVSWPGAFAREYLLTVYRLWWVLAIVAGAWTLLACLLA